MPDLKSNAAYFAALQALVERWCDARHLAAPASVLPVYVGFNGLTDGWQELSEGLKRTRALGHDAFSAADWETLNDLIRAADVALRRR
jgi:hypothetical protein